MKKLIVRKKAEINELDIEHFDKFGEIDISEYQDLLREIKYYIETDVKINNRFWKYVIEYAIEKHLKGE